VSTTTSTKPEAGPPAGPAGSSGGSSGGLSGGSSGGRSDRRLHPGFVAAAVAVLLGLGGMWFGATAPSGVDSGGAAAPSAPGVVLPGGASGDASGGTATLGDIIVRGAYIQEPAASAEVAAAYLSITNTGSQPDTLVSVYCGAARTTTLHDVPDPAATPVPSGSAQPRHVPSGPVTIPAGGTVTLAPGGGHIMLEGLTGPLRAGDRVSMLLSFQRTDQLLVELPVLASTARPPSGTGP
jgi:periplasmic copper chaperone A